MIIFNIIEMFIYNFNINLYSCTILLYTTRSAYILYYYNLIVLPNEAGT